MSCSNVETALEIPQHIRQRIMETENTYIIDVKYLVWNDITESYEWEYYSDYNYTTNIPVQELSLYIDD